MDISTAHDNARIAACRITALEASLALLAADPAGTDRAAIALYGTTRPAPGDPPGGDPLVVIPMSAAAGSIDTDLMQLQLDTPIEGQVTGADPSTGTIPTWARITMPYGSWWADASVSVETGGGEIQLIATGTEGDPPEDVARLYNGAFTRIETGVFQG
jgi:hypothetical protein